jgi:hypothetical protein
MPKARKICVSEQQPFIETAPHLTATCNLEPPATIGLPTFSQSLHEMFALSHSTSNIHTQQGV